LTLSSGERDQICGGENLFEGAKLEKGLHLLMLDRVVVKMDLLFQD